MAIQTAQDMFLYRLGDIYDAEHQFLQGQQAMLAKASNSQLQQGLQVHIQQTQGHIRNLEQVYSILGAQPQRMTSGVAQSLVNQAQQDMSSAGSNAICDMLIDGDAAGVEHFEIASYRGLISGAQQMGQQQIVALLQQNLQQEEQTAHLLEQLAPSLAQQAGQAGMGQSASQQATTNP